MGIKRNGLCGGTVEYPKAHEDEEIKVVPGKGRVGMPFPPKDASYSRAKLG